MKKSVENGNSIGRRSPKILAIFFVLIFSVFLINQVPLTKATFQDNTSLQQIAYDCGGLMNTTNGIYRMNQSINSTGTCLTVNAQNITLDCNGNTINYSSNGTASTYGIYSDKFNTTIKNCNIIDGNWTITAPTTRYGIYFSSATATYGTIYNNSVNVSNSAGIYLFLCTKNNLTSNNATSNSSYGISISSSSNNTLTNNIGITSAITSSYGGIYFNAASNNNLTGNNGTGRVGGAGILIQTTSNNNNITNNNATSISGMGIYSLSSSNNIFMNNNATSNSSYGISIASSSNNTLISNSGISNFNYGIYILTSTNNTLTNNNGTSGTNYGIYLYTNSDNNTLINNTGITNATINYAGIDLYTSSNNTLIGNNGICTNAGKGIVLDTNSTNNTLISNTGTSNSGNAIYLSGGANYNNLTLNTATSTSGSGIVLFTNANYNTLFSNNATSTLNQYGIYLSSSSNNTLTGNNGTSNSSYGIYISSGSNNNILTGNNGTSNSSYGIYVTGSLNNTFINFSWPDYSYISLNTNLNQSLISAILNSSCVPTINSTFANFNYKKSDEVSWQTLTTTRTRDIYEVGDSITAAMLWQKSLDSFMGSNSILHSFAVSSTDCYYSYGLYLNNVTNNSNATVIVFCGVNDALGGLSLANTTYYYEAMYNLSVARGQQIVFVNVGTNGTTNNSCGSIIAINNWLSSFTASKGVPLVDFHSLISTNASACYANLSVTADGVHPNNYGHNLLGKLIWQQGFNSSKTFALNKPLAHFDQGKTYDIKCTSNDDGNIFQMSYTLPSSFTSGGGIIDNASTLNTTLTNVTAKINESSYNSSSVYYDSTLINITSDTSTLEFNYNFSKYDFNFTSVSIDNETVGDKKFLSIWGIAEDGVVGTKSMKIYNANPSYNSVCVKDEENVTSISAACTDTNETKVLCDSNSHSGYVCSISGTTLTITGLKHSGVMQMYQDVSVAAAEDNSGSGPGSFNPSNQTLENGYNANVAKDDKINFKFENETKTILIEKVSADNVEFSIDSKDYSVTINQTLKIDLNSDGYYDIQIFLKSIYSGRAILEVKLINEKIPAEEQASSQEQTQTGNIPAEKKNNNYKWIFIAAGVLILAFVIRLLFFKRRR